MKNLKMLSLGVLAAAALLVPSGTASATTLTSPEKWTYTSFINAESFGYTSIDGSFTTVWCASALTGIVDSHGTGVTAAGRILNLEFWECNYPVTVSKAGSFEIHATGSGNGTVTSSGLEISIHTSVGTCVFTTKGTDIGTLTGGIFADLDLNSSKIPRTGGNFLCGSSGTWTGRYVISSPSNFYVDS